MKKLLAIVFWSVIAAAFIGPGTVTTSGAAGASYGLRLLWALGFSTVATLVLQEASARLTVASGRDLAAALRQGDRETGGKGVLVVLVLGAIVLGCAAYEAGNLLGATAGAGLVLGIPQWLLALAAGLVAGALLWLGAPKTVARVLALLVALMGVAFLVTAWRTGPAADELLRGLLVPATPEGAGILVLALVGTTVVPYNLFLGSGLALGQDLSEIRFGLTVAVVLGGLISMGVLVVGATVPGPFDFATVAAALSERLGAWAGPLFAWGLAAAGLSSAVTAPLAAALTVRGLFGAGPDDPRWHPRAWRYRAVWMGVLGFGVLFAASEVPPIPAIVLAQAFNGVLLPVAAIFLFLAVNDRRLMGEGAVNGAFANGVTALVVAATVVLGTAGVIRAVYRVLELTLGWQPPGEAVLLIGGVAAVALVTYPVGNAILRRRRETS
jgi:manganese transport protein